MMKQVAIVFYTEHSSYDDTELVASRMTEWAEVSDEDYSLLINHQWTGKQYRVITKPDNLEGFIVNTVKEAVEAARKQEQRRISLAAEAKRKADERAQAKAKKLEDKRMKDEAHRRALFEELQKEFNT
jgi:hypothetical protein